MLQQTFAFVTTFCATNYLEKWQFSNVHCFCTLKSNSYVTSTLCSEQTLQNTLYLFLLYNVLKWNWWCVTRLQTSLVFKYNYVC